MKALYTAAAISCFVVACILELFTASKVSPLLLIASGVFAVAFEIRRAERKAAWPKLP